jgi:uncharacterized membrane protein
MSSGLSSTTARALLLGSLALNLALLLALALPHFGIVLGGGGHPRGEGMRIPGPMVLRGALSDERRQVLEPVLSQHRAPVRSAVREARAARRAVDAALRAEPFDRGAFERALAELRERDAVTAAAVHVMLSAAVVELDGAERIAVAERMWRRHRGEWRERRGQDGVERERRGEDGVERERRRGREPGERDD